MLSYQPTQEAPRQTSNPLDALRASASEFCTLADNYALVRIRSPHYPTVDAAKPPMKINGMVMILVLDGELECEINLKPCRFSKGDLIVMPHGYLVSISTVKEEPLEIYTLILSTSFLRTVNISFSAIGVPEFIGHEHPATNLTDSEVKTVLRYFDLLRNTALTDKPEQIDCSIASSITSAMVYQLVKFHRSRLNSPEVYGQRLGRSSYVQDFVKLVHLHYHRERTVSFYADKLCISAKYLSLLVKEATGKSAARWIDDFVIMEAKNMLRYSNKNVQQVAYALNFSTQSSFGKYFKHSTGLSPTDYQKT